MHTFLISWLLASPVLADAATEARLREALRTATTQLHALEEEQAGWKAKEAQFKKELEAPKAPQKPEGVPRAQVEKLKQQLAEEQAARAKLAEALEQDKKAALAAADALRGTEEQRARLAGSIDGLNSRVATCEAKNARLYQVGQSIIDWMNKKRGGEPFLQLKRVELENAAQDYQDKLLDQKVRP